MTLPGSDFFTSDGESIVGEDAFAFLMYCMSQNRMDRSPEQFDLALLDLGDEDKIQLRRYMAIMANHLLRVTLVGNPAPIAARMSKRLRSPEIGDFVYEASAIWNNDLEMRAKGTGILEKITLHPEKTFHVRYGAHADDVCKWANASLYVVPLDPLFVAPVGDVEGTQIVYTRDKLIDAMADQGWDFKGETGH